MCVWRREEMCVSGSVGCKVSVASEPRVSTQLITDGTGANLIRFLGGLNGMMAWHLAHGDVSINISNY